MKDTQEQQFRLARDTLERLIFAGEDHPVERTLDEFAQISDNDDLVAELVYNEHLIRSEQGQSPQVYEFLNRFPRHATRIQKLFSIHATLTDEQTLSAFDEATSELPKRLGPGCTVGPFELIESLGAGGRGHVFKARQVDLGRIVALKVLKGNATNDQEIRRFLIEAKAVANLQHPNIVQVYESDIYENLPYIALEYVSGGTLEDQFHNGPIACNRAARLVATLADAIQHAHSRGIIHRDLKPSNILLTVDGTPKITDFGLAKRLHVSGAASPKSLTETGMLLGTPSFMAPEQAEGRNSEIGPAVDVYGLGAVLYQLITGQVPFVGESTLDVLHSIRSLDPVAPSLLNPKISRDLETICLNCLEKEPARRYASAADLSADLNRLLSGHAIQARPSSALYRLSKLARRHPATTALSAALVASVLVVIAVIGWQWKQAAIGERAQAVLRDSAEAALYSQQLALAHREINSSESLRALEILRDTEPSRRHWEWEYLKQSCDTYETLAKLGPDTRKVLVSPGGELLAVVSGRWGTDEPGMLAVFETESRKLLYKRIDEFGPIMDVAFSPDSKSIATVSNRFKQGGGQFVLHDARTGEVDAITPFPATGIFGVAYHPTLPKVALACANNLVVIYDMRNPTRIQKLSGHRGECYRVAFSPDGEQLASCSSDKTARLWNSETGNLESMLRARKELRSIAYTPDGRYVVVNGQDRAIQFWDRLDDPLQRNIVHLAGDAPLSHSLSISPHGRYLVAIGDGGRRLFRYDLWVSRLDVRSAASSMRPFWLTHHPDGRRVYLVDGDGTVMESHSRRPNPLRRFVAASATELALDNASGRVAVASGTSRTIPSLLDFSCRMLNLSDPDEQTQVFKGAPTWPSAIAVSADGQFLACGCEDGTVARWSVSSGEIVASSKLHEGRISCLSFPASGDELVSVGADGWLTRSRQASKGLPSRQRVSDRTIESAALNPDATHLVLHTDDSAVRLLDLGLTKNLDDAANPIDRETATIWRTSQPGSAVRSLAISSDARYVAVARQDSLETWSISPGRSQRLWSTDMTLTESSDVAFHPDGRRLVFVDGWLGHVLLFDTESGQKVLELDTRSGTDRANVTFSSSGHQLTASLAGDLYTWNTSPAGSPAISSTSPPRSKTEYRNDFQWHVNQASAQIYGGLPRGAEFHASRALTIADEHLEKLEGFKILDVLLINAKCHLAKSLIDTGRDSEGYDMLEELITDCPDQYQSIHNLSLLLATYPGPLVVSSDELVELARRAVQHSPESANAWAVAGIAHLRNENLAEARKHLEHAEEKMTAWDGLTLFPFAVLEVRSEDLDAANRFFQRGVKWMKETSPDQSIIRELRRWAARELRR